MRCGGRSRGRRGEAAFEEVGPGDGVVEADIAHATEARLDAFEVGEDEFRGELQLDAEHELVAFAASFDLLGGELGFGRDEGDGGAGGVLGGDIEDDAGLAANADAGRLAGGEEDLHINVAEVEEGEDLAPGGEDHPGLGEAVEHAAADGGFEGHLGELSRLSGDLGSGGEFGLFRRAEGGLGDIDCGGAGIAAGAGFVEILVGDRLVALEGFGAGEAFFAEIGSGLFLDDIGGSAGDIFGGLGELGVGLFEFGPHFGGVDVGEEVVGGDHAPFAGEDIANATGVLGGDIDLDGFNPAISHSDSVGELDLSPLLAFPRPPAHEGDRPENNQLHQPLHRTTFHRVHPSPDQTVQSINPARGDNRRGSSSRLDGLGSTHAGGGWRVESGEWWSWPGVRGSVRAPLRAPGRVARRWADNGFPSATDASWNWNAGSIAGLALGVVVDWCWAARRGGGFRLCEQRCSDGASHSRRLFGRGRRLAVRYEMERNGAGVSIGRGSRPSVGLRVRQSLQDWSVGRRVPREATCGGCPGLG